MSEPRPKTVPASPKQVVLGVLVELRIDTALGLDHVADAILSAFEEADIDLVWQPADGDVASG